MPCCSRMAARLVLATSSAKALSRKTQVVSPAGASSLCQSTMPCASGSTSSRLILSARQAISTPPPMLWTALPAIVFCLDGHAEVEAELEQQLVEHVRLGAVGLQVLHGVEQRLVEVVAVRLPRADVAGVELEDAEAEIAREHGDSRP